MMAHNITLMQTADDERTVNKSKIAVVTRPITLKEGCSVDAPIVTFTAPIADIVPCNYAYIDTFRRFYWIRDRKSLRNNMVELTLESDPMESFYNELMLCSATIARTADLSLSDGYLVDTEYVGKAYKKIITKAFPGNELSDFSYILMTVG